jgi:hypothetical protein
MELRSYHYIGISNFSREIFEDQIDPLGLNYIEEWTTDELGRVYIYVCIYSYMKKSFRILSM